MRADVVVFGLGIMGGRAAAKMLAAGLDVIGVDPVESARSRAEGDGVSTTSDGLSVVGAADTILLSLPRPEHVAALVEEVLHSAKLGATIVDLSTIDPETARRAAARLGEADITYLDAPVLGRPEKCGNWTLVAGGPADDIAKVRGLLERTIAARVIRVGDVGAGSVVKVLNNLMFGAINAVTAEALTLCVNSGVDPELFVDAIANSGAATVSNLFKELAPRMISGDDNPTFSLDLLRKDNDLAVQLARASRTVAPIAATVDRINVAAVAQGFGPRDTGAVFKAYAGLQADS